MTERTIPSEIRREIEQDSSQDAILVFMTIDHPSLSETIRVVSDPYDHVLNGATYLGFEFLIRRVSDSESAPYAELEIQNVDLRVGKVLLDIQDPATIELEIINSAEFDDDRSEIGTATRIYVASRLELREVEVDGFAVRGRLTNRDYAQELWPGVMATRDRLPGLFR